MMKPLRALLAVSIILLFSGAKTISQLYDPKAKGENPAEEITYFMKENKLFHLHNNDNCLDWDYDMLPGSCSFLGKYRGLLLVESFGL
jgi:hypothetical protein